MSTPQILVLSGGTQTPFWWGEEEGNNNAGSNNANCDGCGSVWDNKRVAPVGSFAPNPFGLYDTAGNVYEWTCSEWQVDFDGSEATCKEPGSTGRRVLRGGSWFGSPVFSRSSSRNRNNTDNQNTKNGFRIFRASSPPLGFSARHSQSPYAQGHAERA